MNNQDFVILVRSSVESNPMDFLVFTHIFDWKVQPFSWLNMVMNIPYGQANISLPERYGPTKTSKVLVTSKYYMFFSVRQSTGKDTVKIPGWFKSNLQNT